MNNEIISLPVFYILLSLASQERHGYGIMKTVTDDSHGKIKLGPGTLYGALKRMLEQKLITEIEKNGLNSERRRYYQISEKGRRLLNSELNRYSSVVEIAEKRKLAMSLKFTV